MDSQLQTVFDNTDGITLLGGGGGMAGKSSSSSGRNAAKKSPKIDLGLGSAKEARAFNQATAQRQSDALNRSFDAAMSSTRGKGFGRR